MFTANVNPGDYDVTGVVIKVNGNAVTTTPVVSGSVYEARWTASAAGQHTVVAEITAGGRTATSSPLQYTVTAADPDPGTDPDPDPNPGTDPDNNQSLEKNFSADDHTQGNPFAGPYSLKLYPSEGGVVVVARFEGNYEGFDGPWLWNYTNGFEETKMTSAGDGSYRYLINNVAPGTTVTVAVKIAYAGGMSVSPQVSYVVPDKAQPVLPTVTLSSDPSSCRTGETVVFTANVKPGDSEVDAVVVRIDGTALVTTPVAGSENTKYSAQWTATSAGDHVVVAEVTAGGRTITSPELRYTVTAPDPGNASLTNPGESSEALVIYLDLSGRRISHPSGMCIMVKGSKATKLVMPVR